MTRREHVACCVWLFAVVVVLGGCSQDVAWSGVLKAVEAQYPDVQRVTTDSLASWMDAASTAKPLLVDARSTEEYAVSHLEGAVHFDPETKDFTLLDTLARDTPVVAYCSVGFRSSEIASRLQSAGFTTVYNLEGSIFKWANEGRPVYRAGQRVSEVHPYNAAWGRLLKSDLHSDYKP